MASTRAGRWVADFETTGKDNLKKDKYVRVWSWGAYSLDTHEYRAGVSLEEFFNFFRTRSNEVYFHNLKFDGQFLLSFLLKNNYVWKPTATEPGEFSTVITDKGLYYEICVIFKKLNKRYIKLTIRDSFKKLPLKVSAIARAFNFEEEKTSIDYGQYRPEGYTPTDAEKTYQKNDCVIVGRALQRQFEVGQTRMTIGADALAEYKNTIGEKVFKTRFPELEYRIDEFCRHAYRGGYVYCNPQYVGKLLHNVVSYDRNSDHPAILKEKLLPYGQPLYYMGEPLESEEYPLFIQRLQCRFRLRPGALPSIQIKKDWRYNAAEYLTTNVIEVDDGAGGFTYDEPVELTLTSVDLYRFFENYEIEDLTFLDGYAFQAKKHMFDEFIDKNYQTKCNAADGGSRLLAKLYINNLVGKMGTHPLRGYKIPIIDEKNIVRYVNSEPVMGSSVYVPLSAFVTAYSRDNLIQIAQRLGDDFIYGDTDSFKTFADVALPYGVEVDARKLGAWKSELPEPYSDFKVLRNKTYAGIVGGKLQITASGLPDVVKSQIKSLRQFTYYDARGQSEGVGQWKGKLQLDIVDGGAILNETTFTINKIHT